MLKLASTQKIFKKTRLNLIHVKNLQHAEKKRSEKTQRLLLQNSGLGEFNMTLLAQVQPMTGCVKVLFRDGEVGDVTSPTESQDI